MTQTINSLILKIVLGPQVSLLLDLFSNISVARNRMAPATESDHKAIVTSLVNCLNASSLTRGCVLFIFVSLAPCPILSLCSTNVYGSELNSHLIAYRET